MWYVIQVRTGRENIIRDTCCALIRQGDEEVFVPESVLRKHIAGEWVDIKRPMFPGYVFFDTDDAESLYMRLKAIPTMTKVLKTGESFSPMSPAEQAVFDRILGNERVLAMSEGIIEGDVVKVAAGPLSYLEGSIVKIDRHKKMAIIEVDFLGQKKRIKAGLEIVERI
ncbi:MAG: antiterminator LoaP [Eubacterium sp.]|nr:antiterminator LoaP [Eubacterium sp.]